MGVFDSAKKITVTITGDTAGLNKAFGTAIREADTFGKKMGVVGNTLKGMTGPALIGAAAAAGAFAIKLGVDGVQAAMEEQRELAVLKQTLDNVGQSFKMDSVNQFIDDLRFLTGVSDSELRPAFSSLIGVTKDAESAQKLLAAAVDASVGSGRDLSSVSMAVAKAVGGSSVALKRLIPELDATTMAGGGADKVLAALTARFGGSARAAAGTFAGQLQRLKDGFDELTESFGKGFLDQLDGGADTADGMAQALRDLQPSVEQLGASLGEVARTLADNRDLIDLFTLRIQSELAQASAAIDLVGFAWKAMVGVVTGSWPSDETDRASKSASQMAYEFGRSGKAAGIMAQLVKDQAAPAVYQLGDEAAVSTDAMSLLRAEMRRTTVRLGFLAAAFDTANAAMEKRQAMKDYKDALKAFIDDPTADTRDAAVQNLMVVAESFKDPTKQAEFTAEGVDKIIDAAKQAGVSVPGWLSAIGQSAADQQDPIASLKQLMEGMDGRTYTSKFVVDYEFPDGRPPGGWPKEWYYATGGPVYAATGTHASDNVPAMLSRGEYVLNADTVKRLGVGTLNRINNGGSAAGTGVMIENLNVTAAPGERAEESVPRALRRYAFVAGLNG